MSAVNSTTAPVVVQSDTTLTEDILIGSMYLLLTLCLTLANAPCLYVMVKDKDLSEELMLF